MDNGLVYFVPHERAAAQSALRPRRLVPLAIAVGASAAVVGGVVAWFAGQASIAPALWVSLALVAAVGYLLAALRAGPIISFAAVRTVTSVRLLGATLTRALPLLLLFVGFLFINAEAWQMTASLSPATLWLAVLLLFGVGLVFLVVRLPDEVDAVDDAVDDAFLARACAGTPMEPTCARMTADAESDPVSLARLAGFERWNLIIALLVVQLVQVLVLVVGVFAFLLLFGSIVMNEPTQLSWTGLDSTSHPPYLGSVSVELLKVSLFLSAFSGLYFMVNAVTDETYRSQFFSLVTTELERAVGVRAVYLAARAAADPTADA